MVHLPTLPKGFEVNRRFSRTIHRYRIWMVNWDMEIYTEPKKNDVLFKWAKELPSNCSKKNEKRRREDYLRRE